MNRGRLILITVFLVAVFLLVYEAIWAPNTFEGDSFITVSKGENFAQVVDSLKSAGIIRSQILFKFAGKILGLTTRMKIGKYRLKSGTSNQEILEDLQDGKSIEPVTITIIEGMRASRQAKILHKALGIDSARFMALVNDSSFTHSHGVNANNLLGYLMPNTYKFEWQVDEESVITEMVREFWTVFDDTLKNRAEKLGMSINEILTLASIIELETGIDSERAVIAGVYYNRLKNGMRLQADPTIQYIIEDGPRRLTYSDLQRESEYNTYRHYGLPPGPINNPGQASIMAALYPIKHKYFYFVANGEGGHTFSRNYSQHQRAVQRYRKLREVQQAMKEQG